MLAGFDFCLCYCDFLKRQDLKTRKIDLNNEVPKPDGPIHLAVSLLHALK